MIDVCSLCIQRSTQRVVLLLGILLIRSFASYTCPSCLFLCAQYYREPFGGLVVLIETAHVHEQFTVHMTGFSWVVWETVDVRGAVVCGTSVLGGQIGPRHAGFVVNRSPVFSRPLAPTKFPGKKLVSQTKSF